MFVREGRSDHGNRLVEPASRRDASLHLRLQTAGCWLAAGWPRKRDCEANTAAGSTEQALQQQRDAFGGWGHGGHDSPREGDPLVHAVRTCPSHAQTSGGVEGTIALQPARVKAIQFRDAASRRSKIYLVTLKTPDNAFLPTVSAISQNNHSL